MFGSSNDTPPQSPRSEEIITDEMDVGEYEEVYGEEVDDDELDEILEDDEELDDDEEAAMREDMASVTFREHKGSVFCCDVHPKQKIAASGGADDMAYVWSTVDGKIIFACTGHAESVTCISFSEDGNLLATGDMGGLIQVWDVNAHQQIWSFEVGEVEWLEWHKSAHVLVAGTGDGDAWLWLVPAGNTKTLQARGSRTQAGALLSDGKRAAVGYNDGSIRMFDLKAAQSQWESVNAHQSCITALAVRSDDSILISGSEDGTAAIHNCQTGKMLGRLNCVVQSFSAQDEQAEEVDNTVEAVSFSPSSPNIVVTATLSGKLIVWDVSKQVRRHTIDLRSGSTRLEWLNDHVVAAAGLDGIIRAVDVRNGEDVTKYTGHTSSILALALSRDRSQIVSASDDHTVRVYCATNERFYDC